MFVYKNVHIFFICQQKMSKLLSVTQTNKKRKAISLETKYEIIEKSSKGVKTSELAEQYEKSTSTISTILKEKEKIIKEYEENG